MPESLLPSHASPGTDCSTAAAAPEVPAPAHPPASGPHPTPLVPEVAASATPIPVPPAVAPPPSTEEFDFEFHRRTAEEQYQKIRSLHVSFAEALDTILTEAFAAAPLKLASIEVRAKSVVSFGKKAATPADDEPTRPKYTKPLLQITDLTGVRIITFLLQSLQHVDRILRDHFQILERIDKADLLLREERPGYQSIHYVVTLLPNRTKLAEYRHYADLKAEIQVRTILQHAWAEIEHDIQYKALETIPLSTQRRFMALAGLLEIADREFQATQGADDHLRQEAVGNVAAGRLQNVPITAEALKSYLDMTLGTDLRVADDSYQALAGQLRRLGFRNLAELDSCVGRVSDDHISRVLWGGRQGQIQRLQGLLIAGMGENIIKLSVSAQRDPSWATYYRHLLERLQKAGIKIGSYSPPPRPRPTVPGGGAA